MNCEICEAKLEPRHNQWGNKVLNKRFCSNRCYHAWITKGKNAAVISRLQYTKGKVSIETALNEIEKNNYNFISTERHVVTKITEAKPEQIHNIKILLEKQLEILRGELNVYKN